MSIFVRILSVMLLGTWPTAHAEFDVDRVPANSPRSIDFCVSIIPSEQHGKADPADEYIERGTTEYVKQDYAHAVEDYSEAIRLSPNRDASFVDRGAAYLKAGDFERAIRDFDEAIRLRPNGAPAMVNRGIVDLHRRDYVRAIEDEANAIRLDPMEPNRLLKYTPKFAPRFSDEAAIGFF